MQSYEARRAFRARAVHPSAYDTGHNLRINILWGYIEHCTSVLERIHESAEAIPKPLVRACEDADAEAVRVITAQKKAMKKKSKAQLLRAQAVRRANEILKEERTWSEFIPMARREREERRNAALRVMSDMRKWFPKYNVDIDDAGMEWVLRFYDYVNTDCWYPLTMVISESDRYLLMYDYGETTVESMARYQNYCECANCLKIVYEKFDYEERDEIFVHIAQGALRIRELLETEGVDRWTLKVARTGCDTARFFFHVGKVIVSFDYYSGESDKRGNGAIRTVPTYFLMYPTNTLSPGKFECCDVYLNKLFYHMRVGSKSPVFIKIHK
jgi:hypothetical protein